MLCACIGWWVLMMMKALHAAGLLGVQLPDLGSALTRPLAQHEVSNTVPAPTVASAPDQMSHSRYLSRPAHAQSMSGSRGPPGPKAKNVSKLSPAAENSWAEDAIFSILSKNPCSALLVGAYISATCVVCRCNATAATGQDTARHPVHWGTNLPCDERGFCVQVLVLLQRLAGTLRDILAAEHLVAAMGTVVQAVAEHAAGGHCEKFLSSCHADC